ncbi:MAG: hypothetical protein ACLR8Y_13120 [Alistipes indistinctus]
MIQCKYTFNHMMVGEEQLAACDSQNRTFWNVVSSIGAAYPKTTACATEYLQRDRHGRILFAMSILSLGADGCDSSTTSLRELLSIETDKKFRTSF